MTRRRTSFYRSHLDARAFAIRWLFLFGIALLVSSCSFDEFGAQSQNIEVPSCSTDSDCDSGLICQARRCVDDAQRTMPIALQLRLPDSGGELRRQLSGLVFEPGLAMPTVEVEDLVGVNVSVLRRTEAVPATVTFRAQRGIPGTSIGITTRTGSEGAEVSLLPGTYDIVVRPSGDPPLPERRFRGVTISADSDAEENMLMPLPLQLVDPLKEKLVRLQGRILRSVDGRELPAKFVRVRAETEDGRFKSTSDTTCEDVCADAANCDCDGSFELWLPAQTETEARTYELFVEPTERSSTMPAVTLDGFEIGPDDFVAPLDMGDDFIALDIGTRVTPEIPAPRTLTGRVVGENGEPVEGALVNAQGALTDNIQFTTQDVIATDANGEFAFDVPDIAGATLTLSASVEQESPWASNVLGEVSMTSEPLEVRLPYKHVVEGTIFGRDASQQLASTSVTATPVEGPDGKTRGTATSTSTDQNGHYELQLEPGSYHIVVQPPASTALPRAVEGIRISGTGKTTRDITIGSSSVVFGAVIGVDGEPSAGVTVDVFAHDPERNLAVLIGAATTDEDGAYRAIIPSPDTFEFPE